MSSEAAQKAYPDAGGAAIGVRYKTYAMQVAFDRGAVEALGQAAAEFREAQSMSNNAPILLSTAAATLEGIADDWVVGQ